MTSYRPIFDVSAGEALAGLPKRKERKALSCIRELAAHPFVRSDYTLPDESGRPIEYILIEQFVVGYWLDHAVREMRIVDIQTAL